MISMLVRSLLNGAAAGAGAGAAATYVSRKMEPESQTPVWTADIKGTTLSVVANRGHGRPIVWELFVIGGGQWVSAGQWQLYPDVIASVQSWEHYLQNGGTVQAWLGHSAPPPVITPARELR